MQTVTVTSARHYTSCKFINNHNLAVLNNVLLVAVHNTISLQGLVDVVLKLHIFRVGKVFDTETNTSVRRILFSFSDESVTKFGDETIEVPVRSVKDVFIELKIGMDMRDVCLGLSRLTGHIASSILPLTSA